MYNVGKKNLKEALVLKNYQVNVFNFREITLSFFMFALRPNESTLKGKNLLLEEQILSFKSRFVFFFVIFI